MIDANVNKIFHRFISIFLILSTNRLHAYATASISLERSPSIVISTNESTDNYFRKSNLRYEKQFFCFSSNVYFSDLVVATPNQSSLTPRFVTIAISIYLFDLFKTTVASGPFYRNRENNYTKRVKQYTREQRHISVKVRKDRQLQFHAAIDSQ